MTKMLHPKNVGKPAKQLIDEAQAAMLAAIDRHFKNKGAIGSTIRASIPAAWDDTDVIVMDAFRAAEDLIEQRSEAKFLIERLLENDFLTQINFNDIEGAVYRCNFCGGGGGHKSFEHKTECVVKQGRAFIARVESEQ